MGYVRENIEWFKSFFSETYDGKTAGKASSRRIMELAVVWASVASSPLRGPISGKDLGSGGGQGKGQRYRQDGEQRPRIYFHAKEKEKSSCKQIAKRSQQAASLVNHWTRNSDSNKKGSDGCGNVETLGQAGNQQHGSKAG